MKINSRAVYALGSLLLVMLLAGCASTGSRSRYIEQIEPGSLPKISAYLGTTNIEIRYPFKGKDAYAYASWPAEESGVFDYQYRYSTLEFEKQPRRARKSLTKHGDRLVLRNASRWQMLVDGVFKGLMPAAPGHGVLLMVQNQEIALYRDKAAKAHIVRLEEKPPEIAIDHAYSQSDFTRLAIELMEENVNQLDPTQKAFLFITDEEPAFVLIDLRRKLIVFLSYPIQQDVQPSDLPMWFTLRALNTVIFRGFVVSALKNPVTLVSRGLWQIGTSGAAALDSGAPGDLGPPPPLYAGPGMDLNEWEKRLDKIVSSHPYRGHLDFLIDGDEFFPALIKSIANATKTIDVMVYIFGSDEYAANIADILKQKSSTTRVRVLMDELGSLFGGGAAPAEIAVLPGVKRPGDIRSYLLANSKIKLRESANPWLTGDHRKCIIVDDRVAYVGGMNIGWQYRYEWHDMMVRLTGPIVGRLEKDYETAWAHAGPLGDFAYAWATLFDRTYPKRNDVPDSIAIRPLRTATWNMEIYRAQLEAIKRARGYIYIENAYFSDDAILRELIYARRRGVDVRVVLPSKNDSGIMQTRNLMMANEMIAHGIRVYAYPGMTHVKAAIYDGWACLGSANLEKMSLRVSQELDIGFSDPATVDRLKRDLFEADFKRAREIKQPVPMSWMDSFIKAFADQL